MLIDSGEQYVYETTVFTRMLHFGIPNKDFKQYYTHVFMGHIALDAVIFPVNTPGFILDILTKKFLWEIEKDFEHGTGHGVGSALNVHEDHKVSVRTGKIHMFCKTE